MRPPDDDLRRCQARSKGSGQRCRAWAMTGARAKVRAWLRADAEVRGGNPRRLWLVGRVASRGGRVVPGDDRPRAEGDSVNTDPDVIRMTLPLFVAEMERKASRPATRTPHRDNGAARL